MKTHIIFVGFMGTGKTTIGEKLAKKLNMKHLDTDAIIEQQTKSTIQTFFQNYGGEAFRQKEMEVLEQTVKLPESIVLTTGGGIVLRKENREIMQKYGWVVALDASPTEIIRRLETDTTRPLLQGDSIAERVQILYQKRKPYYQFADFVVDTSVLSINQVVNQLVDTWFNLMKKR